MPTPESPTQRTRIPGRSLPGTARGLAALALCASAGIHLAQAWRHIPEGSFHGRLHAAFFLVTGLLQIVAALAARAGRQTALIALGNVALASVWALAVTTGLPDWLSPTGPESVTQVGAAAAALEIFAVWMLIAAPAGPEPEPARRWPPAAFAMPSAVAGVALIAAGLALPASGHGHRHTRHADHASAGHGALHVEGVHLHGLGGDPRDPGPDPRRQAQGALAGTRVPAGRRPAAIAVDGGVVWVADREGGLVHRLDEGTGRPLGAPTPVGMRPGGVAVGAGSAWVTNAGSNTVSRLDPVTGKSIATIPVGSVPVGVAVGGGSVWVANSAEGTVSRIDPVSEDVVTTSRIGYGPTAITVAAGRPWVVNSLDRAVVSIDPRTGAVLTQTPVDAGPNAIAFGHGSLWVTSSSAGTVTRLDALTAEPMGAPIVVDRQTQPGQGPAALTVGGSVSVLNNHDKTVIDIDPSTHTVSSPQFIDRHVARDITPAALAMSDTGELWASDHDHGVVVRLRP